LQSIDPYELLGVRPGSSADEIQRALNSQIAAVHRSLDPQAAERLPQLHEAGAALLAQVSDAQALGQVDLDARVRQRRRRARSAALPVYLALAIGLCAVYFVARPVDAIGAVWRMIDLVTGQPQWTVLAAEPATTVPEQALPDVNATKPAPAISVEVAATVQVVSDTPVPAATTTAAPTLIPELRACIAGSGLNVRAGPGTNYERIELLTSNQCVVIEAVDRSGLWVLVSANDAFSGTGWVSLPYLLLPEGELKVPVATAAAQPLAVTAAAAPLLAVEPGAQQAAAAVVGLGQIKNAPEACLMTLNGATSAELNSQVQALLAVQGTRGVGRTDMEFGLNYVRHRDGSCGATDSVTVTLKQTVLMPCWAPPPEAGAALVARWQEQMMDRIAVHEQRHVDINIGGRDTIEAAVRAASCENIEAEFSRAVELVTAQHTQFDADPANHTARWP
jgi:predicted secreted Zn-dependent protease/uncharacterized protein YraI